MLVESVTAALRVSGWASRADFVDVAQRFIDAASAGVGGTAVPAPAAPVSVSARVVDKR